MRRRRNAGVRREASSRGVYLAWLLFTLVVLATMLYVLRTGTRMSVERDPQVEAAAGIKFEATTAHLWFEEILSGDRHEAMEEVWEHLASAEWYAHAMLEGDSKGPTSFEALREPGLRDEISEVQAKLSDFRRITEERWDARTSSISGSDIDQRYDGVFRDFIRLADSVERQLHDRIRTDTVVFRTVQRALIGVTAVLAILVVLVFKQHISGRRRAEQEADLHRERLSHVGRLTTMEGLATGIADELNQPLTAIAAAAQASRRFYDTGQSGSAKHRAALELIGSEAIRAGEIMRRLRAFVGRREPTQEQTDINDVTRDAVKLAEVDARVRGSRIRLRLTDPLPPVVVDPIQIQQVLLNLIRNGLEAMQEAGTAEQGIVVRSKQEGEEEVEIAVEDRGVGLMDGFEAFDPFFSTKSSGMGLGLSISNSIVHAHGGRLWFDRNPQGGVTFRFTLPTAI